MSRPKVTVIMTTFNGEKFVREQIESILLSLDVKDELLISDDGSIDNTIQIITDIKNKDPRIKIFDGPHKGLNKNIEFLYSKCSGDIIFVSDQDDIWYKNKVNVVLNYFEKNPNILAVHHNAKLINGEGVDLGKTVYETMSFKNNMVSFLIKSHIFGSMLAFKRELLAFDLVPPKNCYDAGIACFSIRLKSLLFVDDVLMSYRRHQNNMSTFSRRPLYIIIPERISLLWFILSKVLFLKKKKIGRCFDGK